MKNRNVEFFNLSFLDLLSGALAAVIFLFIIVPKGEPTVFDETVSVSVDTTEMKLFGHLPETLFGTEPGDSVLVVISAFVSTKAASEQPVRKVTPEERKRPKPTKVEIPREKKPAAPEPREEAKPEAAPTVEPSKFTGSKPDVPCMVSIEMKWGSKKDNVDLFVCKDNDCVFGGRRYRSFIGYWDSGKARTSLFGGDLRTNQEAVRQFDEIIPGTYDILAQYKDSSDPKDEVPIRLQVYTKNEDGTERGKEHYFKLPLDPTQRTKVAQVTIGPDGELEFQTFK